MQSCTKFETYIGFLFSIYRQSIVEVLVVDNNSTDDTKDVCLGYKSQGVKYLYQPVIGLSHARNFGLKHMDRDIAIFVDDDVTFRRGWLENLLLPFEHDDVGVVGGELLPVWETPRPDWLSDHYLRNYSVCLNWSNQTKEIEGDEWLSLGNIAFWKSALDQAGRFSVNLGRVGSILLSGDGAVIDVIRYNGMKAVISPASVVDHHISKGRLSPKWLAKRVFWQGITRRVVEEYLRQKIDFNDMKHELHDLRLPTDMHTWASMSNSLLDSNVEQLLNELYELGYAFQCTGFIAN
nr:glycosyltransferase family 2 protein [uncultured Bartonella sp.]